MSSYALPKLIRFLGLALAIPAAFILGSWVGGGKMRELAMLMGLAVACFFFFGIPKWLWLLSVGSLFLPGQLPFLPLPFKPSELFTIMAFTSFVFYGLIFSKKPVRLGPFPDYLCLLGILGILLVHGFGDRFAMRLFGSDIWGGRSYVTLIIAFTAYFVLQSNSLDEKTLKRIPLIAVLFGIIDFTINGLSFAAPSLANALGMLYYSGASVGDAALFSQRLGFAGNFGYLLLFWSLSTCRIQDIFLKGRFFMALVFIAGIALCIISGYRSTLIIMMLIVGLAAFRDLGFTASLLLLPAVIGLSVLIALHSAGFQLPATIQRGLVIIPGVEWDEYSSVDARNSNEFRSAVWNLWVESQFPKHPTFGRGFGLNFDDIIATLPFMSDDSDGYTGAARMLSKYTRDEAFVVSGNIHNGFLSIIDRFGIIGCILFLIWSVVVLRRMFQELLRNRKSPLNPTIQWICLYVIVFSVAYPLGALKIENFLPNQLLLCGIFAAIMASREKKLSPLKNDENQSLFDNRVLHAPTKQKIANTR
jgi:O-antigen ligase